MKPVIDETSYIAPTATIIGNVKIGKNCCIFPGAVIRGDENTITIDDGSNVQDCCVIHVDKDHKTVIGRNVTLGHGAIVHGATIEDNCIIGMHSTILNGAVIGRGSIIGANALVTTDTVIPPNSLVLGVPGKVVKQNEEYEKQAIENAKVYQKLTKEYKENKFYFYP